jgi:hypothetical protein
MNSIYKLTIALLGRIVLSAFVMWPAIAFAADSPDWAYPVTPPPKPLDSTVMRQMPGSTKQYTQVQIDDLYNPPTGIPANIRQCRRSWRAAGRSRLAAPARRAI